MYLRSQKRCLFVYITRFLLGCTYAILIQFPNDGHIPFLHFIQWLVSSPRITLVHIQLEVLVDWWSNIAHGCPIAGS
jgi:hypothetical protein